MSDYEPVDPLTVDESDDLYSLGFRDGWTSTKPRSLSAPLVLGLIAGAFLAGFIVHAALAASRPAPVIPAVRVETAGREPDRGRTEAPRTASAGSRTGASPLPAARIRATPTPRPKPPKVTAGTVRGPASWCAPTPRYCTGWGGDARLAAVRSFRWGDRPYAVRVCRADEPGRCVSVTVVSYCACGNHLIDLSPAAFRALELQSRGVVDVVVRGLR